jgi:hypothetical protein
VPPMQAQVMVEALRRKGVWHLFLALPGEGHGFVVPTTFGGRSRVSCRSTLEP